MAPPTHREDKDLADGSKEMCNSGPRAIMEDISPQHASDCHSRPQAAQVEWSNDSRNPHNWPAARKYTVTILLSAFSFNTLMSSTMVAPALSQIRKDLDIPTDAETQLVLSIYVLAYAVGYFLWAPLSELYGRKPILQVANVWFCVWNLVCGCSKNEATITVARFFSGCGAASSLALGTGTMGEIWRPAQRGRSLAVLSTVTLLGPCIGPIFGAIIAERSSDSWRWSFWSTSMFNGLLQLIAFRFLHESHAPTILNSRGESWGQLGKRNQPGTASSATLEVLVLALKRPLYLVATQPASQGLIIYTGLSFGCLYVLLTVIHLAFTEVYGQPLAIASLHYISFAIGTTVAAQTCAPMIDYLYQRRTRQYVDQLASGVDVDETLRAKSLSHKPPPELRLYPFIPTVLLMVAGLLLFGWSLHYEKHWIVPDVGIALFGAGSQAMTQCTNAYVIDIFSEIKSPPRTENQANRHTRNSINWSASAMASIWATKSLGGFAFPLFAVDLIRQLGWGWTATLLAMLNLSVGLPVAVLLLVHGQKLREIGRKRIEARMEASKM